MAWTYFVQLLAPKMQYLIVKPSVLTWVSGSFVWGHRKLDSAVVAVDDAAGVVDQR